MHVALSAWKKTKRLQLWETYLRMLIWAFLVLLKVSTSVLIAAVGSTSGQTSSLSKFYKGTRHPETCQLKTVEKYFTAYAEVNKCEP